MEIKEVTIDQAWENPQGLDGFAFLEYAVEDPTALSALFESMGFTKIGHHATQAIDLWQQGDIYYLVNAEPDSFAREFYQRHGPSVCGMGFRVQSAQSVFEHCLKHQATAFDDPKHWSAHESIIRGIGDNLLYLVDEYPGDDFFRHQFVIDDRLVAEAANNPMLLTIDHVTHNVYQGNMDQWASFYQTLFNFRQLRYFDIKGKFTGLHSRAMSSPCRKISIPINESADDQSQIQEYLDAYNGEGIQHIALSCRNIYEAVEAFKAKGLRFLDTPDTYYRLVDERLPGHGEPLERMQENRVLIDGSTANGDVKTLLQIFTETEIGPVFFELIERKGDMGFGEGNFQALFDSIELDQIERGVISTK